MISYAQNFEDVMLARVFGHRTEGFYVDVGAGSPLQLSVTKWFYDLGWSGINIEPNKTLFDQLSEARTRDINLDCGAGASSETREFLEMPLAEFSTFDSKIRRSAEDGGIFGTKREVRVVPLTELLDRYASGRHIDFLKIDVEGWEQQVLRGLDLQRYRPTIIVVEATKPGTRVEAHQDWEDLLIGGRYCFAYFDGLNRFYLANEHLHLKKHFDLPPNVFDEITGYGLVAAESERIRRETELTTQIENLRSQMDDGSEDRSQDQIRDLQNRVGELEARVNSLANAFSHRRHQSRRNWLRPPLWTFEQYAPRKLRVSPAYRREKLPSAPMSIALVTPSFNHRIYLPSTIESVLTQNYPRLNYLVQDGASTDGTTDLLRSYDAKLAWRSERDDGQAQAINRGFSTCDGDIMGYLNSDDMLLPGALAYVAGVFQARPDIDFVYGHRVFVNRDGMEVGRAVLPRHDAKALYWADYVPQETMFWRRRVWNAVGPLDESFEYALDWDFILKAQHAGFKFLRLPRFIACFRVHDQQKTSKIYDKGWEEMQRLREQYLGVKPSQRDIIKNVMPYLLRQLAVHVMHRLRILRY